MNPELWRPGIRISNDTTIRKPGLGIRIFKAPGTPGVGGKRRGVMESAGRFLKEKNRQRYPMTICATYLNPAPLSMAVRIQVKALQGLQAAQCLQLGLRFEMIIPGVLDGCFVRHAHRRFCFQGFDEFKGLLHLVFVSFNRQVHTAF